MAETPARMTVPQLKAWLSENNVETPATVKRKAALVELVESAMKKNPNRAKGDGEEESVDISKMTIDDMIEWLQERGVELPEKRKRKAYYTSLVESHKSSGKKQSSSTGKRAKTPEPARSAAQNVRLTRSARRAGPGSRRVQLLARPPLDFDESSEVGEEVDDDDDEEEAATTVTEKGSSCVGKMVRAFIAGVLLAAVMYAYIWWGYVRYTGIDPLEETSSEL